MKFQISNFKLRMPGAVDPGVVGTPRCGVRTAQRAVPAFNLCRLARAFTLIEVLVVVSLLALIVLALMTVFNSTQQAFRAGVTQSDVLENSRAAVNLIASDLRTMTPSDGIYGDGVNFCVLDNNYYPSLAYSPLEQSLPPGTGASRTNVLNNFFLLSRENTKWIGIGYAVNVTSVAPLYPLYRFSTNANISTDPRALYDAFTNAVYHGQWTSACMSHIMDGVIHLVVRPYDVNGYQMVNTYQFDGSQWVTNQNTWFSAPVNGEVGCFFYSNAVPASVELQMGVLEDRALQRAESRANGLPPSPLNPAQWSYLQNQSGAVHVFCQRVLIPNVDPSAYQ